MASARTERWIARADRLEDYWRDYAFLGLTEELHIGGRKIEVQLLTLRIFIQLCAVRSPFMVGGHVGPEHVAQILWRLSPEYGSPASLPDSAVSASSLTTPRKHFIASISDLPFKSSIRAVSRYLDRMLIDKPPTSAKRTGTRSDTSFAASVIHQLASAYGWSDELILDIPMPRLFQYMRKIHRAADPDLARFNPIRDRFVQKITSKVLAARKARREEAHTTSIKDTK